MKKGIIIIIGGILGLIGVYFVFFGNYFLSQKDAIIETPDIKKQEILNTYNTKNKKTIEPKTYRTLTIALPKFLYDGGFMKLKKNLKKEFNFEIKFLPISGAEKYREIILGNKLEDIDIILIPSEWRNELSLQNIELYESLIDYFDPLSHGLISEKIIIPFAIDPLVTLVNGDKILPDTKLSTLLNYYSFVQNKKIHTLVSKIDQDILNVFLIQSQMDENINILNNLKKLLVVQSKKNEIWDRFESVVTGLGKNDKQCTYYPNLCLFNYGFTDVRFGYLSDTDILQGFQKQQRYAVRLFPYYEKKYPIRVRGFALHEKSDKVAETRKFLQYLIREFQYSSGSIIPAIVGESYYTTLIKKDIMYITSLKDKRYIIEKEQDTANFLKKIHDDESFTSYYQDLISD